ncbi:MAG TPA: ATP-dependent helicase HrpB, partial [Gemmatimonadaceae bacterium]|nr:ATP-dependent helicase HrpB [Gemmatimonadaceae bacterium]
MSGPRSASRCLARSSARASNALPDVELPVAGAIPDVTAALADPGAAVLVAPPGAGKTTRVPLALVEASWLAGRRIVMLEPRRIAARTAARWMAALLDEDVGATVGFRIRDETRVSRTTRIEVVTEGVLTRMLQSDPTLDGVGAVIFDEIHERSVHSDVGLALTLHARALIRPDLRVLAMSATVDGARVAEVLGGPPVIRSEGRAFPVETRWVPRDPELRTEQAAARAIRRALGETEGDVLVFLPGAGEIARTHALLGDAPVPGTFVVSLFGALPGAEQDRALRRSPPGMRKIVLATSIAETSLTIDGVRVVVDVGLSRVPRYSPARGMTTLETVRVSRASADQRRGRAGRTAPGVCYRLWAEHEEHHLVAESRPEILESDLAPIVLDLLAAGVSDPGELRWMTPPPAAAIVEGRELLRELGAIDAAGKLTAHGRALATLPMHPRLGHMLLEAGPDAVERAAAVAALLNDRDVARGRAGEEADLAVRVEMVLDARAAAPSGLSVDRDALAARRDEARRIAARLRALPRIPRSARASTVGELVALAYPDRVARARGGEQGRYLMRGGGGAALVGAQLLTGSEYLAVAELDGRRQESRIHLAAALDEASVRALFADQIEEVEVVEWDEASESVRALRRTTLGAIVLDERRLGAPDPERPARLLLDVIARRGTDALPWSESARRLRERLAFLHAIEPDWPDVSTDALGASLEEWLLPRLGGARSLADVARIDLGDALLARLDWRQRARLDELAPTHLVIPTGSRIRVDYS